MLESFWGQEKLLAYLERALQSGKLHHAYLFSGPAGIGKSTLALLLAQALNCLAPETDAARECVQCQKIRHGNHPDVRLIAPEGTFIKIDQIRALIADANLKPLEGRRKVYILTQAERLKNEAANALLKVLEEPGAKVTIILTTEQPAALLPTIRSRCLALNFTRLPATALQDLLVTHQGLTVEAASSIALLADGRPGRALTLSSTEKAQERQELLALFTALLNATSYLAYYELINKFLSDENMEIQEKLRLFAGWLRDLILLRKGIANLLYNADQYDTLAQLAARYSPAALEEAIYRLHSLTQLLAVNLNQRLYLENTFRRLWDSSRRIK